MQISKMVIVAAALVALVLGACGGGNESSDAGGEGDDGCNHEPVTLESGLEYKEIECGDGETAEAGDTVFVHYTGKLADGTEFDSSEGKDPLEVTLGTGGVIAGFDEGLTGMKLGGKRKLTIPPELGYGPTGSGPIPPNATLIFEVEIVDIKKGKQ